MRKIVCLLLLVIAMLVGCSKQSDEVTVLQFKSSDVTTDDQPLVVNATVTIYHQDGIVNKSLIVQEVQVDEGSQSTLKELEDMAKKEKKNTEELNLENYRYDYELKDNILKTTIEFNYHEEDLKVLAKDNASFEEILNEDNQVEYDKLVKVFTDTGYELVDDKE